MIIAETAESYRFVTQPDHAALAGVFADHWGNDRFGRPTPPAATTIAAYQHDLGWERYDRRPHLHDDGRPVDFREMPPETWRDLYDAGIDAVTELDAYAGLLVSMHGTGLRRQRYGLSPSWPETPAEYEEFVERQEALQARLADELQDAGELSAADTELLATLHEDGSCSGGSGSRLWRNYRVLQAWDMLSLAFCTTHDPPGFAEVGDVPAEETTGQNEPADETLSIERVDTGEFTVAPYPFDAAPLETSVPARAVAKDAFDDEEELVRAYYEATRERIEVGLSPAE